MPSSIVTAVPTGTFTAPGDVCIQQLYADFDSTTLNQCANSTLGTKESDFETICCDGMILDTTRNLYAFDQPANRSINLVNLICCGVHGPQQGGIGPIIQNGNTACTTGVPTPLSSLAATNVGNAAPYVVTYTSASFGSATTAAFIPTLTPYCMWANTASGVALRNVTVPAAHISTPPAPLTNFDGITTASLSTSPLPSFGSASTGSGPTPSISTSAASALEAPWRGALIFGLVSFAFCKFSR